MKWCYCCNEYKSLDAFGKNKSKFDGYASECKLCKRISDRKYREINAEKVSLGKKKCYNNKKEQYLSHCKNYYITNKNKISKRNAQWKKDHKDIVNLLKRKREAIKRKTKVENISENDIRELKKMYNNSCAYCGAKESIQIKLHMDHVYPLSRGGAHTLFNIIPACEACNVYKQNKLPLNWIINYTNLL